MDETLVEQKLDGENINEVPQQTDEAQLQLASTDPAVFNPNQSVECKIRNCFDAFILLLTSCLTFLTRIFYWNHGRDGSV
jgi:hypothetical protein